ncbi:type IX secretion system membrane protein PorP/SprF [Bacteroidales bacterium OttesenSCG-928-I21]|nr:type IX secretion system membrane protein PorP/SprF [Bacteroidales bacterium OttesenSCG-928-I21]
MRLKILILSAVFGFSITTLKSQDRPIHEQYIFDYMLVNPCFTGLSETSAVKLSHRQQWIGINEAPRTSFLLLRHRLKTQNFGIGSYIFTDSNGPNSLHGIQISGSYHVLLKSRRTKKIILSFGLSARGEFHILDESKFNKDIYDPAVTYTRNSSFLPNANAGILISSTNAFFGYTVDNLIPYIDKIYSSLEMEKHFLHNFHIGKIWKVGRNGQIRPALTFKSDFRGQNQMDLSFRYYFLFNKSVRTSFVRHSNDFWIGILYKQTLDKQHISPLSISPAFGFSVNKFTLSYLYDFGLTSLLSQHYGTHQITIGFKFAKDHYSNWGKFDTPHFQSDF